MNIFVVMVCVCYHVFLNSNVIQVLSLSYAIVIWVSSNVSEVAFAFEPGPLGALMQ